MSRLRYLFVAVFLLIASYLLDDAGVLPLPESRQPASSTDAVLAEAFADRRSNIQVQGHGIVVRILRDDTSGDRHQKFILQLLSGQQLLVAHNIDLAPRIDALEVGDSVNFFGEYEWNERGGVIHWTHHDPGGRHPDGWLRHRGITYR